MVQRRRSGAHGERAAWLRRLYQGPTDPKLKQDRRRLDMMMSALVAGQIDQKAPPFAEISRAAGLASRLRMFLQAWLSLSPSPRSDQADAAIGGLRALDAHRVQIQALQYWALSDQTDAPDVWKKAMHRRGFVAMPWRLAVGFAEDARFAIDRQWLSRYAAERELAFLARAHGGAADMTEKLRSSDASVRDAGAREMQTWLRMADQSYEAPFRRAAKLAEQARHNAARLDMSPSTRDAILKAAEARAPDLAAAHYSRYAPTADGALKVWHDRYGGRAAGRAISPGDACSRIVSALDVVHPRARKIGRKLLSGSSVYLTVGRGGGFTTPVLHDAKGRQDLGPFVHAPFDGGEDGLRTLAHEMGHAVQGVLSAKQGPLLADAGWAVSETAALTVEAIVFQDDVKALSDQDFALLVHQPGLALFEQDMAEAPDSMAIDHVWRRSLRRTYGSDIDLETYGAFWRRHTGLLSSPGYPAAYVAGWSLAQFVADGLTARDATLGATYLDVMGQGGAIGFEDAASTLGAGDPADVVHRAYDRALARLESV